MIKHKCNKCSAILENPDGMAGKEDFCPICGQKFIVIRNTRSKLVGRILVVGVWAIGLSIPICIWAGIMISNEMQNTRRTLGQIERANQAIEKADWDNAVRSQESYNRYLFDQVSKPKSSPLPGTLPKQPEKSLGLELHNMIKDLETKIK